MFVLLAQSALLPGDSTDLDLGFGPAQLSANRIGKLLPEQAPPFLTPLLISVLLLALMAWLARWIVRHRAGRARVLLGLSTLCLVAWFSSGTLTRLVRVVRDRAELRACSATGISSGMLGLPFGGRALSLGLTSYRAYHAGAGAAEHVQKGQGYRVYYACHSHTLASAERSEAPPARSRDLHRRELSAIFGFDSDVLAANRGGRLTLSQRPFGEVFASLFALLIWVGLSLFLRFALRRKPRAVRALALLPVAVIAATVLVGADALAEPWRELWQGKACETMGTFHSPYVRATRNSSYLGFRVGAQPLLHHGAHRGLALLQDNQLYRAFYRCSAKELVSIEPIGEPLPLPSGYRIRVVPRASTP